MNRLPFDLLRLPTVPEAIVEESDPLLRHAAAFGLTVADVMAMHLNPLVFRCNEPATFVIEKLATIHGYTWEFIRDDPEFDFLQNTYWTPIGKLVMHHVG